MAAVLLGLFAAARPAARAATRCPTGAVAAVGDGVVTQAAVRRDHGQAKAQTRQPRALRRSPSQGTTEYDQVKAQHRRLPGQNEIIAQKAAELDIAVTDEEIDEAHQADHQSSTAARRRSTSCSSSRASPWTQLKDPAQGADLQEKVHDRSPTRPRSPTSRSRRTTRSGNKAQFDEARHGHHAPHPGEDEGGGREVQKLLEADASDANWKAVAKEYSERPGHEGQGRRPRHRSPRADGRQPFDKAAFASRWTPSPCRSRPSTAGTSSRSPRRPPAPRRPSTRSKTDRADRSGPAGHQAWEEWLKKATEEPTSPTLSASIRPSSPPRRVPQRSAAGSPSPSGRGVTARPAGAAPPGR